MGHKKLVPCSQCGDLMAREFIVAKNVAFRMMGAKGRMIRSRAVAHLCLACLNKDEDFLRPEGVGVNG